MTPKQLLERFDRLKADRSTWESHWQECGDYFLPNHNNIIQQTSKGAKLNTHLLDSTGIEALMLLASFVQGALFNPTATWFEYTTGDDDLDREDEVRVWLQKVVKRMHTTINDSNFQTEVHEKILENFCFGTSGIGTFEDDEKVVRFKAEYIGGIVIEENNFGIIDRCYRSFCWTAQNIAEEWGEKALSDQMKRAMERDPLQEYEIVNGVFRDVNGKKWKNMFVLREEERELTKQNSGKTEIFNEYPYSFVRLMKVRGEKYGRSYAMNALPDMKILNKMTETEIRAAQRAIDPPLQADDETVVLPLKTAPGSINFKRPGSSEIKPLFNQVQVDFGYQALGERRDRIKSAFFVDQLKLVQNDRMTTEEVIQRTQQAGSLLGPMLARYATEFLPRFTDRVFQIMFRRQMFPPVPEALQGRVIKARFTSTIARAQKLQDAQNILRALEMMTPFIQLDPTVADNIDGDKAVVVIAQAMNFPQELIRNQKQLKMLRQARERAQQEALQRQQAQMNAQTNATNATAVAQLSGAMKQAS